LKQLDTGGDGKLDAQEILAGIRALHREKEKTRQLLWITVGLFIFLLLLLGAVGGMLYFVIQVTKDSTLDASGAMIAKGSNKSVQVSSTDFSVVDGVLVPRTSGNLTCSGGFCPRNPVQVTQVHIYIYIWYLYICIYNSV
jgi:hypothetical protein